MPGVARLGADSRPACQNCHQTGLGRQCVTARGRPMMPLPGETRSSLSDPLSSQVPGSSTATVTAGDAVVSGKVDRGTVHLKVASEQPVRSSPPSSTRTTTTLGWISTRPRAVVEISGHLAKTRNASGTGTTLLVDSCPLKATHYPPARITYVIQASFLPGPHRLALSSLMHGAAAKMTWLQESHNVRVNCHHLSCGHCGFLS